MDFNEGLPEGEHNYVHVGKVGSFVPVIDGVNGGLLLRKNGDSYNAVVGTKDIDGKKVRLSNRLETKIKLHCLIFYRLMDDAIASIKAYGELNTFVEGWDEPERNDEYLIGFDEVPQEEAVANATILKGD